MSEETTYTTAELFINFLATIAILRTDHGNTTVLKSHSPWIPQSDRFELFSGKSADFVKILF